MKILQTASGIQFGIMGEKPSSPRPTLVVIANDMTNSLENDDYNRTGKILAEQGWISVALDTPCHGADRKEDEPQGLNGWRARLEKGENFTATYNRKASEVLTFLVEERYSDPQRIAVAGTSRGGFMALHLMAAEPRVQCVVAFAPVSELPVLDEFKGMEKHPLAQSIELLSLADKLTGRPIWICIGNNDQRVGTDQCISLSRKIVMESVRQQKPAPIEIHVMQTEGHRIHETAHDEAAAWLAVRMNNLRNSTAS